MNEYNDFRYPQWQIPAQEVLLETDPTKLREKVETAEIKISDRLRQIQGCSDGHDEQDAIKHTLSLIRSIERERLGGNNMENQSGSSRGFTSESDWRALYRDAVLETDFGKLLERIDEAEKGIAERVSLDGEVSVRERRELECSRNSLQLLRTERTGLHTDLDRNQ